MPGARRHLGAAAPAGEEARSVIMASTLTRRNARRSASRRCRSALPTTFRSPRPPRRHDPGELLRRDLNEKVRELGRLPPRGARRRPGYTVARRAAGAGARARASDQAARVCADVAARLGDRLVDRRTAGAHDGHVQPARPAVARAGADHAAHAADLHDHPGRAHRARGVWQGARGHRWRAGRSRHDLRRSRRQAHAGGQARQRRLHRARRRSAGELRKPRSIRCSAPPPRCGVRRCSPSC